MPKRTLKCQPRRQTETASDPRVLPNNPRHVFWSAIKKSLTEDGLTLNESTLAMYLMTFGDEDLSIAREQFDFEAASRIFKHFPTSLKRLMARGIAEESGGRVRLRPHPVVRRAQAAVVSALG